MQNFAIVYFPKISLEEIQVFRHKYDPAWNIINPHITLVFPVPDISENLLLEHIGKITEEIIAFPIILSGLLKSFDDYLFLQVEDGQEEITILREKLYSGIFAPYKQAEIPFVPHMTLGYFRVADNEFDYRLYNKAYSEADDMSINIQDYIDNITLIKGDGLNPATVIKVFKLRG